MKSARKMPIACTTIFAKDKAEFLDVAKVASRLGSDLAELRIDHLLEPSPSSIGEIIEESPLPLIVTSRSRRDGGLFGESQENLRLSLLESSFDFSPALVDVELEVPESKRSKLIRLAKRKEVGVIHSHHNFSSTPTVSRILTLAEKMSDRDVNIIKLVFSPNTNQDAISILEASNELRSGRKLFTIFGMGAIGKITRPATLLFGSSLIYCSVGETDERLGQIDIGYARTYIDRLQSYGLSKIKKNRINLMAIFREELKSAEVDYRLDPLTKLAKGVSKSIVSS